VSIDNTDTDSYYDTHHNSYSDSDSTTTDTNAHSHSHSASTDPNANCNPDSAPADTYTPSNYDPNGHTNPYGYAYTGADCSMSTATDDRPYQGSQRTVQFHGTGKPH
jgi:hypothetical protein